MNYSSSIENNLYKQESYLENKKQLNQDDYIEKNK